MGGTDNEESSNSRTLSKLKLFRSFYILVVSYIYFTRVVVYLFATVLSYRVTWLRHFITEIGTLSFYVVIGFKFRPEVENPYMQVLYKRDDELEVEDDDTENLELVRSNSNQETDSFIRKI